MRLYIAGPMSGYPDLNFRAFFDAEEALRSIGVESLNPARNECTGWKPCMRAALRQIADADDMAMLPGWEQSRGARIEHRLGLDLDMEVMALEQWIDRLTPKEV